MTAPETVPTGSQDRITDSAAYEYPKGYDRCSECHGYGLVHGHMGEPTDCPTCLGGGIERKRDEKGRYAS